MPSTLECGSYHELKLVAEASVVVQELEVVEVPMMLQGRTYFLLVSRLDWNMVLHH
jgi:hypothetical protein